MNPIRYKVLVGCALITALSACANRPAPATDQEQSASGLAYIACLHESARKIDDGKSDAATIAMAIRPMCSGQFALYRESVSRGENVQVRRMVDERFSRAELDYGTRAVLDERAKR